MPTSSPARKPPNIWALASVTYGAVILVTIASVAVYYYAAPKQTPQPSDAARSVSVGSVWIPVYPGSMTEGTASTKQDHVTESTMNFETTDPADRVLAFYGAALKKGVFRFDTVAKSDGGGTVRSVVHEGKTTVLVTIRTAGGRVRGEVQTIDRETRDTGDKATRN